MNTEKPTSLKQVTCQESTMNSAETNDWKKSFVLSCHCYYRCFFPRLLTLLFKFNYVSVIAWHKTFREFLKDPSSNPLLIQINTARGQQSFSHSLREKVYLFTFSWFSLSLSQMEVFTIIYTTKEVAMETLSWIGIEDFKLR